MKQVLILKKKNRKPDVLSTCSRDPFITNWSPWVHVDKAHSAETVGGSKWGKAEMGDKKDWATIALIAFAKAI